ncbi:MAG TPA: hypothetical protein VK508_18575 [Cyclobacteriaceae bacterium]|nr:hypothetical protein [Cyclobacteriaceae bacterium]
MDNEVHVIHLKHRHDRMSHISEQLTSQGINNYRFWEGVIDSQKSSRGIAQAHQQIILWARIEGKDEIIVAEDDLTFTGPGAFRHFIDCEPPHYDLYLGGISYGKIKSDNTVDDFAGTHLYKVKRHFFDTFLSLTGEKDVDRDLARRGKFIVCNPMVAIQCDGYSDNTHTNRINGPYFKNRVLWTGW